MFAGVCSKLFKIVLCSAVVCSGACVGPAAARAGIVINMSTYAAVAYSTSTGEYGYAWNMPTRASAEAEALSMVDADDAEIVGWVQGGFLAVAIGNDYSYGMGFEYGDGASSAVAADRAQENCLEYCERVDTLIIVCSGNFDPQVIKRS